MSTEKLNGTESQSHDGFAREYVALRHRRHQLDGTKTTESEGQTLPNAWGLAISGGGIRSATFGLGFLQAIAQTPAEVAPSPANDHAFRQSLLSRFDYMSTVSGGGYIGGFLTALLLPGRFDTNADAKESANKGVEILQAGPPKRFQALKAKQGENWVPLAWLRDNGRYLLPTGSGDAFYAAGLALRNLLAIHYVIGSALLMVFALLNVLALMAQSQFGLAMGGQGNFGQSPWFLLVLAVIAVWLVPSGLAYWFAYPSKEHEVRKLNAAVAGAMLLAVAGFSIAWCGGVPHALGLVDMGSADPVAKRSPARMAAGFASTAPWAQVSAGGAALLLLGIAFYLLACTGRPDLAKVRVRLTQSLGSALQVTLALGSLALVDWLARALVLDLLNIDTTLTFTLGGTAAAGMGAAKWLIGKFNAPSSSSGLAAKLPLSLLAGLAGLAILFAVATLWAALSHALPYEVLQPSIGLREPIQRLPAAGWFLAACITLSLVAGKFFGFVNGSTLQPFYAGRLIRSYLGASNAARFPKRDKASRAYPDKSFRQSRGLSSSEPVRGDDVSLSAIVLSSSAPKLVGLGPLHIVNLTINQTSNPTEQLAQRDRKGIPLAVSPLDKWVDGVTLKPVVLHGTQEIYQEPTLGRWLGLSGAAFSTGLGRQTSLGLSLLMGSANVRLGQWWCAGHDPALDNFGIRFLQTLFPTQLYLFYECTARFHGMGRRFQYLSDGGHFENTALYELLRPERNLRFVLASDNGADPDYAFDDLANLVRLVRIDHQREIEVDDGFNTVGANGQPQYPGLAKVFGGVGDFALKAPDGKPKALPEAGKVGLLLKVGGPPKARGQITWVALLKPSVDAGAPQDVRQYLARHPEFPQEPTADQMFDEAQWESYRALGQHQAARVLQKSVLGELRTYCKLS